jgi:hypothetical protein
MSEPDDPDAGRKEALAALDEAIARAERRARLSRSVVAMRATVGRDHERLGRLVDATEQWLARLTSAAEAPACRALGRGGRADRGAFRQPRRLALPRHQPARGNGTPTMRLTTAALLPLVPLAACAITPAMLDERSRDEAETVWRKPGATERQRDEDYRRCEYDATKAAFAVDGDIGQQVGTARAWLSACMEAKGWERAGR